MQKFDFSVQPERISIKENYISTNGLFKVLQLGYSRHYPISIRPDDIINNYILNLTVDFNVDIDDNENEFKVLIESGPTQISHDLVLKVQNRFAVKEI